VQHTALFLVLLFFLVVLIVAAARYERVSLLRDLILQLSLRNLDVTVVIVVVLMPRDWRKRPFADNRDLFVDVLDLFLLVLMVAAAAGRRESARKEEIAICAASSTSSTAWIFVLRAVLFERGLPRAVVKGRLPRGLRFRGVLLYWSDEGGIHERVAEQRDVERAGRGVGSFLEGDNSHSSSSPGNSELCKQTNLNESVSARPARNASALVHRGHIVVLHLDVIDLVVVMLVVVVDLVLTCGSEGIIVLLFVVLVLMAELSSHDWNVRSENADHFAHVDQHARLLWRLRGRVVVGGRGIARF
jgi:hypothetical protein